MGIALHSEGNVLVVKIDGELDHHVADGLRESVDRTFENRKLKHIVFDFSEITMMDSSGIGFVMGRYKKASELGGKAVLVGTNPYVTKVFEMAGVFSIVKRCGNLAEAKKLTEREVK